MREGGGRKEEKEKGNEQEFAIALRATGGQAEASGMGVGWGGEGNKDVSHFLSRADHRLRLAEKTQCEGVPKLPRLTSWLQYLLVD